MPEEAEGLEVAVTAEIEIFARTRLLGEEEGVKIEKPEIGLMLAIEDLLLWRGLAQGPHTGNQEMQILHQGRETPEMDLCHLQIRSHLGEEVIIVVEVGVNGIIVGERAFILTTGYMIKETTQKINNGIRKRAITMPI